MLKILAIVVVTSLSGVHADEVRSLDIPGLKVAQFDADDTYDPFADYSEFDEAQEEEADINFFRHGRFVTIGFTGGMRGFTQGMGKMFSPAPSFGLFLSYFFDLRFALQFGFNTSDHAMNVTSAATGAKATGTVTMSNFSLDLKYYVNTQNVTKGLAKVNPYFIMGFARVDRTVRLDGAQGFGKEGAMGFDLGGGIEMPMMRNKMYFGVQGLYQMVNFPDKNTEIVFDNGDKTKQYPNGDTWTALGILGVNF